MCNRCLAAILGVLVSVCCFSRVRALADSPPVSEVNDMRVTAYALLSKRLRLHAQLDVISESPKYTGIRPSVFYRNRAFELGAGYAWLNDYAEPSHLEHRAILRARLTQSHSYGSQYEQLGLLERWYPDTKGVTQSSLRMSGRYAQNYWTGTRPLGERIQRYRFYEEVAWQTAGTGGVEFDYGRLWAMYEMPLGGARLAVGFRLQESRKGSGEPPDLTYGPQVQLTIGE